MHQQFIYIQRWLNSTLLAHAVTLQTASEIILSVFLWVVLEKVLHIKTKEKEFD